MKKLKIASIKIIAIFPLLLLLSFCSPIEDESESNSILIINSIMGKDMEGNDADFLQSDVLVVDSSTGAETVIVDTATAALTAKRIEPEPPSLGSSQYNSIMLNRYIVSYSRIDKQTNIPGVDVPYSFEGALSTLIEIDETVNISFVIVREVAKLEPPLFALRSGGPEGVMQVKAQIDFYGEDLAKKKVKATGYLTIFFANYANE